MEEMTLFLFVDNLFIRKCRQSLGIPVYHAHTPIDVTLVIQFVEDADHAFRSDVIHRERSAFPIARCSELAKLLQDYAAILVCPIPCMIKKLLTGKVGLAIPSEASLATTFASVEIAAWSVPRHPQRVLTLHAGATR